MAEVNWFVGVVNPLAGNSSSISVASNPWIAVGTDHNPWGTERPVQGPSLGPVVSRKGRTARLVTRQFIPTSTLTPRVTAGRGARVQVASPPRVSTRTTSAADWKRYANRRGGSGQSVVYCGRPRCSGLSSSFRMPKRLVLFSSTKVMTRYFPGFEAGGLS